MTRLSVVLPAFNEQESVRTAVERALEVLPELADEWEVIVVDDGSTDRTAEVLDDLLHDRYPQLRLVQHDVNHGYGAALRTGFSRANHDLVFYTEQGLIKGTVNLDDAVDGSFVEAAVKEVGPYRRQQ
jgi:glycosyltransferase involved in cell wall biosynthesis